MARAGTFYGRGPELAWLKRTLLPGEAGGAPPLVLIHGGENLGKTALVQEFGRQVLAEKTGHPAAAFWWEGPVRAGTLGQFVELLLASGRSNVPRLQQSRGVLSGDGGGQTDGSGGSGERRVSAYNNDGTVRDLENTPLVTLAEEEVLLAKRFVERLVKWMGSLGGESGGPGLEALFRMIFVFDAFESYPTAVKNWLGRHLLPAMQSAEGLPGQSLLLTGRQSWQEGEQGDYWQAPPGSFHQMGLSPLDRHACEQWLAAMGEDVGMVDLLLERTDGFPGRIERVLAVRKWWEQVQAEAETGVLAGYSARERRWLHAAAMARTVTVEMLQIMLGRKEAGEAYGWLREQAGIGWWEAARDEAGERLHLREEVRDEIIRQVSSRVPARHREFLEKMNLWTDVSSRVESSRHRQYLGELSPIQPFNEEMIRDLFGANG